MLHRMSARSMVRLARVTNTNTNASPHKADKPDRRATSHLTPLEQQIMDAINAKDDTTLDALEKALEGKRWRTKRVAL